jgi:hypothetical protein
MGNKSDGFGVSFRRLLLGSAGGFAPCVAGAGVAALLLAAGAGPAKAFNVYDGSNAGNDLEINLTTELSYSTFYRVNGVSSQLGGAENANGNDGDANFRHGFVGNQFEALPVLDIKDGNYGAHVSGEFYLNTSYLGTNQNNQPGTNNTVLPKNNDFSSATRNVNGLNARLLDAFVFAKQQFGNDQTISLKFGRQTLLWGQSLFFTNDGIAAGQAPIDILTAQSLPNPQAQQVFLPVGQAVLTYQPFSGLTIQGYYQFEYQHDNFQGVGAYFNSADLLDKGAQRVIFGSTTQFPFGLPPGIAYLNRAKDSTPPIENGQFGISVQDTVGNYDLGLYALRYDAKAPALTYSIGPGLGDPTPGGSIVGFYRLVYPRDIQLYGASVSTTIGDANVAGEISGRRNMPLVGGFNAVPAGVTTPQGNAGAFYPVGSTGTAQASALYVSPGLPADPGGVTVDAEVEMNHVFSIDKNKANLAPGRNGTAGAFEVVLQPTYYDVLPSLEVDFPIGITYDFLGRSEMDQSNTHGDGEFTFGVKATYQTTWIATLTYADYLGKPDATYNGDADRGYLSLQLQHSF